MCECGGQLGECVCGDRCCVYCGCRGGGVPDVDYGPVWVDVIDTPAKPPYGSPERVVLDNFRLRLDELVAERDAARNWLSIAEAALREAQAERDEAKAAVDRAYKDGYDLGMAHGSSRCPDA